MPSIPLRQKFTGGEISPLLHGDTDFPKYGLSLKTCKNWVPTSQGALVVRPGTSYSAHTRNDAAVWTVGYQFPDGRSYLFEFSDLVLRVLRNGALVGAPYELVTPWTAAMLPYLKFMQVGNVVTIFYGGQVANDAGLAPRDLIHAANTDSPWTLVATQVETKEGASQGGNWVVGSVDIAAWSNLRTYQAGERATQGNYSWTSLQTNNLNNAPPADLSIASLFWTSTIDESHPGMGFSGAFYLQTAMVQETATGKVYETGYGFPLFVLGAGGVGFDAIPANDRPVTINLGTYTPQAGYTVLYFRLYKGTSYNTQLAGWIADIKTATTKFVDNGINPDYSTQAPADSGFSQQENPFVGAYTSYPAAGTHFDQRRLMARSSVLPMTIWGSAIASIYRFDRPAPGSDRDAVKFDMVSEVLEEVRSMAPMRVCLVMTGMGEWTLRGSQAAAVTRTNVDLKRQSQWGSSWRDPLVVGTGVLFNTAKSNMVRDLYPLYGLYTDVWDGDEISWKARHFMEGRTIVSWAFQKIPYAVAWMVRDDGALLSLTYDRKREVVAWAQHSTGTDFVENVAVVPEGAEDAVYLVVRRTVNGVTVRYHERMGNLIPPADVRLGVYLDAASSFDGRNLAATTVTLSGGTWLVGTQATAASSVALFAAADAGASALVFDPNGAKVYARIVGFTDTQHVTVEFDADLTVDQVGAWTVPTVNWALAKSIFSMPQLAGYQLDSGTFDGVRGVMALVDGDAAYGLWDGANFVLPAPYVVVKIGIAYNSDVELLDAYHPTAEIRNRLKRLVRVGFSVVYSRGFWVGQDFANMFEWGQRTVADSYGQIPLATGYFEEFVEGDFNKEGRAALRRWEPLPMQLSSALREMELGGT